MRPVVNGDHTKAPEKSKLREMPQLVAAIFRASNQVAEFSLLKQVLSVARGRVAYGLGIAPS